MENSMNGTWISNIKVLAMADIAKWEPQVAYFALNYGLNTSGVT